MNKEVIIFDKDGTLLDFDAFWISVSEKAILSLFESFDIADIPVSEALAAIGVENGSCDIDGVLCKGTYEEIGVAVWEVIKKYGYDKIKEETVEKLNAAYCESFSSGVVKPICDNIRDVLKELKDDGKTLLVVTTDNREITDKCLRELGIDDLFEKVFTDDGITPVKPDPKCILDFCSERGIPLLNVCMVGDTMTDIRFARNAGISVISVGSEENLKRLSRFADAAVLDISFVAEKLKKM